LLFVAIWWTHADILTDIRAQLCMASGANGLCWPIVACLTTLVQVAGREESGREGAKAEERQTCGRNRFSDQVSATGWKKIEIFWLNEKMENDRASSGHLSACQRVSYELDWTKWCTPVKMRSLFSGQLAFFWTHQPKCEPPSKLEKPPPKANRPC